MKVIGITSGKGGVGKTTVAVNLAVELANRGLKVALLDGDLGLSNAQILLNARVEYTYAHVLAGVKSLADIIVESQHGVKLIPGSSGSTALSSLTRLQLLGLIHAVSELDDCDVLVVDTAAGISDNVTFLFAACDIKLLLIQNEPASIADAYATFKVLQHEYNLSDVKLTPVRVGSQQEAKSIHDKIDGVTAKFLGLRLGYSTGIRTDADILEAARQGVPAVNLFPNGNLAQDIKSLAHMLLQEAVTDSDSGVTFAPGKK